MDDESARATRPAAPARDIAEERQPAPVSPGNSGSGPKGEDDRAVSADDRYEREIDLDSNSTHARVVGLVGVGRRVLELGPATGHMSRVLADRDCSVVGIEFDPEMAKQAALYCERIIVGDLDELDLDTELGADRFDVIVAADVLEHLRDPLSALRRLRGFLAPDGFFVISLPNIAHGSVRLALLEGHFSYRKIGLLDTTHLRFFTRESIDELLDKSELGAAEIFHQELNIEASEVPFDPGAVPAGVWEALQHDPDARIYQFVIKAIPFAAPGLRELQRRMRELAHDNARLREAVLAQRPDREAELRGALINAHDQMLRRDEQIYHLQEETKSLRRELAEEREQELRLRVRLDRILNSPPARAYSRLGQLPGVKGLVSARTAGYRSALSRAKGAEAGPHG